MIVGHYATALVAHKEYPLLPLWACMVGAMFLDIVMGTLLVSGVEHMTASNPETPKLYEMTIDMTYSHDLLPVLGWSVIAAAAGFLLTRTWLGAAIMAGLVILHELMDLVGGFHHFVFGPETARVGLGLYHIQSPLSVIIELMVCLFCVFWFFRNTNANIYRQTGLYAVMIIGCLILLPMAT